MEQQITLSAELTSTKARTVVTGDLAAIIAAAIAAEEELQPAGGITIDCDDGRMFECVNGRVAVYAGGWDGGEGVAMMVDGELMIAWEQGTRTPFVDTDLQPA